MSRLAKKPIIVPSAVEVSHSGGELTVKGPLGSLQRRVPPSITFEKEEGSIRVTSAASRPEASALLGTTVAHLKNMIAGVSTPFAKKLIIEGIGFKAEVKGAEVVLSLGFSHQIKMAIPAGLKVVGEKGALSISGSDIEAVGQFAARLRALKKPEPYKGKGIRYEDEIIRRKQGKKTV